MEEKLGARLLNRSTRHLSVTEVGRDYFERASSILAAAEAAESAVAQRTQEPKGRLKVTAGAEFGTMRVDGWIAAFLRQWPKVTVEAEYTNRIVDIIHEGVDVAIRIGTLQDSELSARKLEELTYGLYASPEYLRSAVRVRTIDDLKRRHLIMHAPRGRPIWTLVNGGPRGITVNAVAPGWTRTDMNAAVRENTDMVKAIEADTAFGRFGETSDIAAVVAFLASDQGRWVTGQIIEVSGGYRL